MIRKGSLRPSPRLVKSIPKSTKPSSSIRSRWRRVETWDDGDWKLKPSNPTQSATTPGTLSTGDWSASDLQSLVTVISIYPISSPGFLNSPPHDPKLTIHIDLLDHICSPQLLPQTLGHLCSHSSRYITSYYL